MELQILILGEGGQGVQLLGDILANAASENHPGTSSKCNYTPAARGGEVIASVVIADKKQIYPLVEEADYIFVMSSNKSLEFISDKITDKTRIFSVDPAVPDDLDPKPKRFTFVKKPDDESVALNIFMLNAIREAITIISPETIEKATQKILGKKRIGIE